MNIYKMIAPNYTEEEVWDLLSEYLGKKFLADQNTIQRGIYVDLYRDGSFFEIIDNPDEFAYLYCNRNLNFNISGNILFSVESDKNEEFTLESICHFLNKPFPKPITPLDLSPTEFEEKQKNLSFIKKVNKINFEREKTKTKITGVCVEILHAFEYTRALKINDNIYHIEQLIGDINNFNFIQERNIFRTEEMIVVHPNPPLLDELLDFVEEKKELIKEYFQVRYSEVLETIKTQIYPNYETYFSERMRRFGSLLIPLYNVEKELVSCVNIVNITDNKINYLVVSEKNQHTSGSFQINTEQITSNDSIYITLDIETADVISRCNNSPIFAALNEDNFIRVLDEVQAKYPDNFIVLVSNNPFVKYLDSENEEMFRKSLIVKLMLAFARSNTRLLRCGLIIPTVNLAEKSELKTFSDIFLEFGLDEACFHINQELSKALERLENDTNESEYILDLYNNAKSALYGNHHIRLPELVTDEELKPPKHQVLDQLPEQPLIPTHGVDSVLHIEGKKDLIDWFNEPINPDIARKERMLQEQMGRFMDAAPVERDEEFNPRPLSEHFP